MRRKEGFTLIELLAVIVILSIIALIAIPIVLGIVERVEKSSYKESLRSLFKATDLYIASTEFNEFPDDGINVIDENIKLKNKNFVSGKIVKNESGNIELDRVSNGKYCGSGPLDNIVIIEGGCDQLDDTPPTITIGSGLVTSSRVTIVANSEDLESGISGYQFSKDNGSTWTSIQVSNVYTFTNLVKTTSYTFKVRVYNNNGLPTISNSLEVTTQDISLPTYSVDVTGWSQSKVVTINYPDRQPGYVYEYSLDGATTWIEVESPATTQDIPFTENGTVIARILDGANEIGSASYDVTNIDTVAPVITVSENSLIIEQGSSYNDTGVTAIDDMLGDITGDIVTTGSVDTGIVGTYTLTYNVSDEAGNAANSKTRTVYVVEATIIAFTSSKTWTVPSDVNAVDVLVVAGGGGAGGGTHHAGGGGAGGLVYKENYRVDPNDDISVSVGSGGALQADGQDSSFGDIVAIGGGAGGNSNIVGNDGGSGGGGGSGGTTAALGGNTLQPTSLSGGFGNVGGTGAPAGGAESTRNGAGGGGAGSPGANGTSTKGGNGGTGLYYGDIFGEQYGENGWFAGGGGGGNTDNPNNAGTGGSGGGGGIARVNGLANTGGGGGFVSADNRGTGGSGVVIVKYLSREVIKAFVLSQNWTVPSNVTTVDVLVVAGGGGAGGNISRAGGGGAGGLIYKEQYVVNPNDTISVSVGSGGALQADGQDSSFGDIVAIGGGAGGNSNTDGNDGGSGGGGGSGGTLAGAGGNTLQPTSLSGGFGNNGGSGAPAGGTSTSRNGGGGGGAGSPGSNGTSTSGGDGGTGLYYGDIFGIHYGENGWFAGGGGGGNTDNTANAGDGGLGGGGGINRVNGLPGTGGGGGFISTDNRGTGGSGIVLIKYFMQ